MSDRLKRLEIEGDRVMTELARVAFANVTDVVSWDEGSTELKLRASTSISEDIAAAIAEVSIQIEPGKGVSRKIKMHNKIAALTSLAKIMGLELDGAIAAVTKAGYKVVDPRLKPASTDELDQFFEVDILTGLKPR